MAVAYPVADVYTRIVRTYQGVEAIYTTLIKNEHYLIYLAERRETRLIDLRLNNC